MHVRAISLYPHQSSILLYRCGPDVEGLVEREELLHCETWEVCMYHPNHLKERGKMSIKCSLSQTCMKLSLLYSHVEWCLVDTSSPHQLKSCQETIESEGLGCLQWHPPARAKEEPTFCTQGQMPAGWNYTLSTACRICPKPPGPGKWGWRMLV